ncbi:heme-binding domain-containing protein [Halpernia sp. GG3]
MQVFKTVIFWFVIAVSLIQFIPVDRENKPVKKSENFTAVFNATNQVKEILKNACYDCHSNETVYPYYAFIAPFSWSIKHHINEGREHLNFSEWTTFNSDLKKNMLENSVNELQDKSMPMAAYIPYHPKSNLTDAQRKVLINYFQDIIKSQKY